MACSQPESVLSFVDVSGVEGPIGILSDGSLFHLGDDRQRIPVNHGLGDRVQLAAVSPWDDKIVLSDVTGKNLREVWLRDRRVVRVYDLKHWREYTHTDTGKVVPQAVRNRFSKIFVDAQGRLGLISRRSESIISLAANHQVIMQSRRAESPDKRVVIAFHPTPAPQGAGYSLQVARWKDGSLAWLDSRGMLHLKSSDQSLPEMTLVLRDGALAGWTSEGWTFGMDYFTGETEAGGEEYAYHNILEGFVAALQ